MLTMTPDLQCTANSEGPSHATLSITMGSWLDCLVLHYQTSRKLLAENLNENSKYPQKKTALVIHIFLKNSKEVQGNNFNQRKLLEILFLINQNAFGHSLCFEPLAEGLMG